MNCPSGHDAKQIVIESRQRDGMVYRKRCCAMCGSAYHTKEEIFVGPIVRDRPDKKQAKQAKQAKAIYQWPSW